MSTQKSIMDQMSQLSSCQLFFKKHKLCKKVTMKNYYKKYNFLHDYIEYLTKFISFNKEIEFLFL